MADTGGRQHTLFKDAVMGVGVLESPPIDLMRCGNVNPLSIEILSTGTPTGTYVIVTSNLYDPNNNPNATFTAVAAAPSPAFPVPAGAGAQTIHTFGWTALIGRWVKLRYTGTAGAGVLNASAHVRPAA
jgi:hypothetical protein